MPRQDQIQCIICEKRKNDHQDYLSFHSFPRDESIKKKWIDFGIRSGCLRENDNVKSIMICSEHFLPTDYAKGMVGKCRRLKKEAVPSKIVKPIHLHPHSTLHKTTNYSSDKDHQMKYLSSKDDVNEVKVKEENVADGEHQGNEDVCNLDDETDVKVKEENGAHKEHQENEDVCNLGTQNRKKRKIHPKEFTSSDMDSPKKAKKFRRIVIDSLETNRKKIKSLRQRQRRMLKRITSVQLLLNNLKKKNLLSGEAAEQILDSVPVPLKEVIGRKLKCINKKKDRKYSPELRKFALTLQFYSSRAYQYVRKMWRNLLPHPSTIKNWYSAFDGRPGFTDEAFKAISIKIGESESPVFCNIVVDEIKIRDQIIWSKDRFYGTVDMGTDFTAQHDKATKASYALVFMAVALNQSWKVPVGYFFIKSLIAEERANLLLKCLELMCDTGANVNSITFDGASTNISMVNYLGANLTDPLSPNFQPWFRNPFNLEKIFIFLDPCHMVKLIRNIFGDLKILTDNRGQLIKWQYIVDLVELQKDQGLYAANKVTKKHIEYNNNRMSVKLATQVLSESTAKALTFLQERFNDHPNFRNSEATSKFCLIFNNAFDILNCHSKFSKKNPFCLPLSIETRENLQEKAQEIIQYVSSLKDKCGTLLLKHPRKTGILGIIMALKNIFELFDYLQHKGLKYLLSFKISQDFIETFFSAIRSRGGWNNNPNAKQFESAYKRLLVKHEIGSSMYSNCLADGMDVLHISSHRKNFRDPIGEYFDEVEVDECDADLFALSPYVEDIVKYIGGAIIGKIKYKKYVQCTFCLNQLVKDNMQNRSRLTELKDRGPYVHPSENVNKLCLLTEKVLRIREKDLFVKTNIKQILIVKVLRICGTPFNNKEMDKHVLSQSTLDNHRIQLAKIIIEFYIKIRLFYFAKVKSNKDNLRQKYNRLVIFKGK